MSLSLTLSRAGIKFCNTPGGKNVDEKRMIRMIVIESGNRDERCYRDGHTWGDGRPYYWNLKNGWWERCLVCGSQIVIGKVDDKLEADELLREELRRILLEVMAGGGYSGRSMGIDTATDMIIELFEPVER